MLTADLKQNAIVSLYLLFSHNYIVFAYLFGLMIAIITAVVRPSRFSILMLLGFAVLVFSFEYDKHIIAGFREQTLKSLITATPHYRLQRLINLVISEVIPIALYFLGWLFIYVGLIAGAFGKKQDKLS